jgi:hypothetical protein
MCVVEEHLNNVLSYLESLLVYLSQLVVTKNPEEKLVQKKLEDVNKLQASNFCDLFQ